MNKHDAQRAADMAARQPVKWITDHLDPVLHRIEVAGKQIAITESMIRRELMDLPIVPNVAISSTVRGLRMPASYDTIYYGECPYRPVVRQATGWECRSHSGHVIVIEWSELWVMVNAAGHWVAMRDPKLMASLKQALTPLVMADDGEA